MQSMPPPTHSADLGYLSRETPSSTACSGLPTREALARAAGRDHVQGGRAHGLQRTLALPAFPATCDLLASVTLPTRSTSLSSRMRGAPP
jgi:hypothetical protein